jgi:hypothetical protein
MTERSYEDAVQVLKRRFGGRWEGLEADGRDDMIAALKDELGYDGNAARDAIDEMIRSGEIRYERTPVARDADMPVERSGDDPAVLPLPAPGAPVGMGTGGSGNMPAPPLAAVVPGHWVIGRDTSASDVAPGRAGQVDPTL